MSALEETFTDKEFCHQFKVNRATSARWRDDKIVGYVKLPNGQIRYRQRHIDELWEKFEKLTADAAASENVNDAIKGRVVDIGIAERRSDIGVA